MAAWACQNPSCKSHGAPHPHCRCPAPMAKGGKLENFCDSDRAHETTCEFAEGGLVPPSDLPQDIQPQAAPTGDIVPTDDLPADIQQEADTDSKREKYGNLGQQALSAVEGAGEGFAGPLATGAEMLLDKAGVPGLKPEDIEGRAEANPWTHGIAKATGLGAGLVTGVGEAGLAAKAAGAAAKALKLEQAGALAKIGSTALKGAIEAGLVQGGDEVSKAMLGQKGGDPEAAVASALSNVGIGALTGGALGGVFGTAGHGLNKLADSEMAKKGAKLAGELGDYWQIRNAPPEKDWFFTKGTKPSALKTDGAKLGEMIYGEVNKAPDRIIKLGLEVPLSEHLGYPGYAIAKTLEPIVSKAFGKPLRKMSDVVVSTAIKALGSGEMNNVAKLLDYASAVNKGQTTMNKAVDSLFTGGRQAFINDEATDRDKEKINKWIDQGGVAKDLQPQSETPQFAEGGAVQPEENTIAKHYPDQDMLLNAAKGRVSQYLMAIKPQQTPKLPFDPETKNKEQHKLYDRAVSIAAKPLSIVNHIKNGTLTFEQTKHFTQMYPEIYKQLAAKMTNKIVESQQEGTKPPYKVRQSMSLFLGSPLDSTMTPSSIMAAQATYQQPKAPQGQPEGKTKKGTSTLGKDNKSYKTTTQAAESDRSSRE